VVATTVAEVPGRRRRQGVPLTNTDFGPDLGSVFATATDGEDPELIQLLTPDGERREHPDYAFDLDDEAIRGFYRDLVLSRRIDTEATALQRQGELGIWASLLGQEAAQVGSARAMAAQDYVFPTYREHAVAWCRDVDPLHLLSLFRGVDNGGWDPRSTNFALYTIVIGAQTLHAVGYAMGMQRDGVVGSGDNDVDAAVTAYFGDGATSQGDVNEASSGPACSTHRSSSSARTTSGRSLSPSSDRPVSPSTSAPSALASPVYESTATTYSPATR
jgi:pyruvate dehydrogenase E1 component alpha subunit